MMKNFKYPLLKKYDLVIRDKFSLIRLLLNITSELLNYYCITSLPANTITAFVFISINNRKRVFIIGENSIQSFHFPFTIISNDAQKTIEVQLPSYSINVSFATIEILKEVFFVNHGEQIDINKIESNIDGIFQDPENQRYFSHDEIKQLVYFLIAYESGYIRFDHDEEHQGLYHPINHFDINYTNSCTYKIGLNHKIDYKAFQNILDDEKSIPYINLPQTI